MTDFAPGMAVHCIDNKPRVDFAEWYADDHYSEDMLSLTARYIVRAVLVRDGQLGIDVGIPTPWGDPYWSAARFRPAPLREPSYAIAAGTRSAETRSKAPSEGCQSGPKGIAQKGAPNA